MSDQETNALELRRPHGFLLWRGKKAAIARPAGHELPAVTPLQVTTDGEVFGTAVLGEPVALPVLEFDEGTWFKDHRIFPKERASWWPGETEFLVYPVAEFKPLTKPQWMTKAAPNYGPTKAPERCPTCLEYSDGFCRLHDQVVEDDHVCDDWDDFEDWRGGEADLGSGDQGPVAKAEEAAPEPARKAIEPAELEDWRGGEARPAPSLPKEVEEEAQKQEAEEAEAMPYEKRQQGEKWCVFKEGADKPMKCYGDEDKADAYLTALRINVEAAEKAAGMTAEKEVEIAVRAQEITKALGLDGDIEAILREYLLQKANDPEDPDLDAATTEVGQSTKERGQGQGQGGEPQGDGGTNTCVCPECGKETEHERGTPCSEQECPECEVPLAGKPEPEQKAAEPEADADSDTAGDTTAGTETKAGRRVKKPMLDRVKGALRTLAEFVGWAEYEDQQEGGGLDSFFKMDSDHGMTVKTIQGQPMMLTWTTNAFKDRQKEIFSTKCLEQYVLEAEKKGDRGTYDLWHIPGSDFAEVQWQGVVGRFLVEAGPFMDTPIGRKAKAFFTKFPDGHPKYAPEGWGSSPEFRYLPEERKAGTYNWIWLVRRAVLPRAAAANVWTRGMEVSTMAITKQQKDLAEEMFGEELLDQIITQSESRSKELEEAGVAHKAADATDAETEVEPSVDDDAEVEEAEPEEETKEEPSEDGEPEGDTEVKEVADPEEKPQVEVDVKAVAEQLASIFEVKLEPLNQMSANIGALAGAIKAMGERVQALEGGEQLKKQVETPRFVLNLTNKASEAEETAIEDDDPLLKMKPAEAEKPAASGAANFFTGK